MNIPLLLMIPLSRRRICIIATVLRLNLPPLKHTSLSPPYVLAKIVIISLLYALVFFRNYRAVFPFPPSSENASFKNKLRTKECKMLLVCVCVCARAYVLVPLSRFFAPCVASSLYLTIFSAETGTCRECFYVPGSG